MSLSPHLSSSLSWRSSAHPYCVRMTPCSCFAASPPLSSEWKLCFRPQSSFFNLKSILLFPHTSVAIATKTCVLSLPTISCFLHFMFPSTIVCLCNHPMHFSLQNLHCGIVQSLATFYWKLIMIYHFLCTLKYFFAKHISPGPENCQTWSKIS